MASNIHKQRDQELAEMVEDQDPRLQDPQECHQFCTDRLARLATWPRANSLMTKLHSYKQPQSLSEPLLRVDP